MCSSKIPLKSPGPGPSLTLTLIDTPDRMIKQVRVRSGDWPAARHIGRCAAPPANHRCADQKRQRTDNQDPLSTGSSRSVLSHCEGGGVFSLPPFPLFSSVPIPSPLPLNPTSSFLPSPSPYLSFAPLISPSLP